MSASITRQDKSLLLRNSRIAVTINLDNCFRIESFTDVRSRVEYGGQRNQQITFDRQAVDLAGKGALVVGAVTIEKIADRYQNAGQAAMVRLAVTHAAGELSITRHIFIYDDAGAVRIYDTFSSDVPLAGMYYSDLLQFSFGAEGAAYCMDYFCCTDQSNFRLFEKEAEYKNRGSFFIRHRGDDGLFFYKEGPSPDNQPIKGEYDFIYSGDGASLSVAGLGFDKIHPGEERRANGIVVGLIEDSGTLLGIKRYQKARYRMDCREEVEFLSNSWPAFHLDVTEEKILGEIKRAEKIGLQTVFIDDGWFETFMGEIDAGKFPSRFDRLQEKAEECGVRVGLWMNPFGLDSRDPQAAVWDGAEKYDCNVERNPWNWMARAPYNFTPVEFKSSEGVRGYYAMDICNPGYYAHIKDKIVGFYRQYRISRFKLDLYQLHVFDTLLGDQNIHYEMYRRLLEELKAEIPDLMVSMDITRANRPSFDFAQDFGRLFLENRGRGIDDYRYYHPWVSLGNLWEAAKYVHPQKIELEVMPQIDDYPVEYVLATACFANMLYWGALAELTPEKSARVAAFMKTFNTVKQEIMAGMICVIGERPRKGNWSGFISFRDDGEAGRRGYVIVYRNGSDEATAKFAVSLLNGKFAFSNVFDQSEAFVAEGSSFGTEIAESFGFRLYRFEERK
jgi:hypothetical protein